MLAIMFSGQIKVMESGTDGGAVPYSVEGKQLPSVLFLRWHNTVA